MDLHSKLSCAIAAILGSGACTSAFSADTSGTNSAGDQIQEIIVTAQRRTENIQNVPIAIQALTGETLTELNVTNFDDLVKYLPNVTASSAGPGQSQIFMRGLSVGNQGTQSGGSINGFPNVAIYLDEQSGQLPGRNLDVYAADLERVEVLEGPQGTLFGAGAQAGVIRYITNKPKIDVTEGSVTAGYGITAGGDPNSDVTAVLNLPLIDRHSRGPRRDLRRPRGGYINNVPGTFTRKPTDLGIHYAQLSGDRLGVSEWSAAQSSAKCRLLRAARQPVAQQRSPRGQRDQPGDLPRHPRVRLSGTSIATGMPCLTQSYQNIDAEGVFYQMPNSSDGVPLPRSRSRCSTLRTTRTSSRIRP